MGYPLLNVHLLFAAGLLIVSTSVYCVPTYPAVTYYVKPTPNTPCPEEGAPCFTLTQYAAKPPGYFANSSTLLSLLPGNHSLVNDKKFRFQGSYNLTIVANKSTVDDSETFVTCSRSARFVINNMTYVYIKGLVFLGCMNSNIARVYRFTLEDCVFRGLGRRGSALLIFATKQLEGSANISRSSFYSNSGRNVTEPRNGVVTGGGAIVVRRLGVTISNCTFANNTLKGSNKYRRGGAVYAVYSNVTINNGIFKNNCVPKRCDRGGAMYAFRSVIDVHNSTFLNNIVTVSGGALYANRSVIAVNNSIFLNNIATKSGGAVYSLWSTNTSVVNSTFVNNVVRKGAGGGALFVICARGTVLNVTWSKFANNFVNGYKGGALSAVSCHMTVSRSNFSNNTLIAKRNANNAQRGGAMYACAPAAAASSAVTILSSTFVNNRVIKGDSEGTQLGIAGALHFSNINVDIYDTMFTNNAAIDRGGAVCAEDSSFILNNVTINNNAVTGDEGQGGAIAGFQSVIVFIGTTNLMFNSAKHGGAIFATESKLDLFGNLSVADNTATSSGGGIYAYQSELNFQGRINITRNRALERGGGIHAVSSTTRLGSSSGSLPYTIQTLHPDNSNCYFLHFSENSAVRGGGMCLELYSKLYVIKAREELYYNHSSPDTWLKLNFTSNSANYGGAIYVTDDTNSGACNAKDIPFASGGSTIGECFFQALAIYDGSELSTWPQKNTLNILNTNFTDNSARIAGDTIYGGLLDRCTVDHLSEIFYKTKYIDFIPSASLNAQSYLLNTTNMELKDFTLSTISSDPVRLCFCRDNKPDCSYHPPAVYLRKGETFRVSLVAVDQVNNTVSNTYIHYHYKLNSVEVRDSTFESTNSNGTCTELEYTVQSSQNAKHLLFYADGPCLGTGISASSLVVNFLPCPIGFVDTDIRCECDPYLYPEYVSNCSIDTKSVLRRDNAWFSFVNTTEHQDYVLYPECPFDYCHPPTEDIFVNLNIPHGADAQCAFNRSGKLCGSCKDGLSLSLGSSRCRPCSNNWLALILLFAVAGIALVAFILMCNLTVATGTINGLIFYANIVTANRAIFFPTYTYVLVLIAWINLDFGFETCFFDGMDGYAKVWLQLAFPLYVIILVIAIIVICDYSPRFAALFTGKDPIATLATLILLSYAKLIRTIIAVFSFARIKYTDGTQELVWLYDANVPYLKGKHIPLFIAAIGILIFGIVYTFMVSLFFWQWLLQLVMQHSKSHSKGDRTGSSKGIRKLFRWVFSNSKFNVHSFVDTYQAPYNKDHRYWVGLLLLVRVLLYLVSAVNVLGDPRINLLSINSVIVGLLFFQHMAAFRERIHKSLFTDVIENSFFLNLIGLASITFYITNDTERQARVTCTSAGIAFVTFLVVLAYHTYLYAKQLWKQALEEDNHKKDIIAKILYCVWMFIKKGNKERKRRRERQVQRKVKDKKVHEELLSVSETETVFDARSLVANYAAFENSTQVEPDRDKFVEESVLSLSMVENDLSRSSTCTDNSYQH